MTRSRARSGGVGVVVVVVVVVAVVVVAVVAAAVAVVVVSPPLKLWQWGGGYLHRHPFPGSIATYSVRVQGSEKIGGDGPGFQSVVFIAWLYDAVCMCLLCLLLFFVYRRLAERQTDGQTVRRDSGQTDRQTGETDRTHYTFGTIRVQSQPWGGCAGFARMGAPGGSVGASFFRMHRHWFFRAAWGRGRCCRVQFKLVLPGLESELFRSKKQAGGGSVKFGLGCPGGLLQADRWATAKGLPEARGEVFCRLWLD